MSARSERAWTVATVAEALTAGRAANGEASGLPHDLHHQQRSQGAGWGAEPEERGGVPKILERRLG
ncbi:MAG: hypothetical protein L7H02_07695 [Sulfolobales archaeon]|nr:hypothetical protein [Sulfolobales archaeon]